MPKRVFAASMLSCMLLASGDVGAVRFREPQSNLELDVGSNGAQTCVLVPASMTSKDSCKGIDTTSAAKKVVSSAKGHVSLAAFVHFADWGYVLLVSTIDQKGVGEMTSDEIPKFAARVESEIAQSIGGKVRVHGDKPGSLIDKTVTNGVHTLRWQAEAADPGATERVIGYNLFERDRYHVVTFVTDPSHQAEVRALADQTMKTLSMPVAKLDFFGQSPQAKEAAAKGLTVTPFLLMLGVVLVFVAIVVYRRRHVR